MDLQQVLTGLESARQAYDAMVKEATGPLKEALSAMVRELGIKGLIWTQYTPYYNDGDECIFSVNEPSIIVGDPAEVDSPYDDEHAIEIWSDWEIVLKYHGEQVERAGLTREQYEAAREFARELASEGLEDVLRQAFGDHVMVKVTADGVEVDDYDHD